MYHFRFNMITESTSNSKCAFCWSAEMKFLIHLVLIRVQQFLKWHSNCVRIQDPSLYIRVTFDLKWSGHNAPILSFRVNPPLSLNTSSLSGTDVWSDLESAKWFSLLALFNPIGFRSLHNTNLLYYLQSFGVWFELCISVGSSINY